MIQSILFAHDFSPSSRRALSYAADLANRTKATLHLIHVEEVPLGPLVKGDPTPIAKEEALQEELQRQLRDRSTSVLETNAPALDEDHLRYHTERSGAVAPALVRHAERIEADLIVMGTKGQRGLQKAFVGSVAREVLRTAPCPVLSTRALEDDDAREASVERIVSPIDFSDPSREALQYTGGVASVYEVPIKLVHAIEPPTLPSVYGVESPKISGRNVQARAERALAEWAKDSLSDRPDVSYVVRHGDPASLILDAAPSPEDLLVMATRGLSGVRRTMLGSVTETIICEAAGPVLAGRTFPTNR